MHKGNLQKSLHPLTFDLKTCRLQTLFNLPKEGFDHLLFCSSATFLAPTGALEVGMSDLCLSVYFMLRRALKEFLKHSKESRGV